MLEAIQIRVYRALNILLEKDTVSPKDIFSALERVTLFSPLNHLLLTYYNYIVCYIYITSCFIGFYHPVSTLIKELN